MTRGFSGRFAEAWANPTPERLVALLHPDVLLRQPHRPPVRGKPAALEEFRRLFAWLPGLHGVIDRAVDAGDIVFIEWRMQMPVGSDIISIPAVDRFRLKDGLGFERVVYFDQMALVAALARHPRLWPGYVRYRLRR